MKLGRRKFLIGTGLIGGGLILGMNLRGEKPVPFTREGTFQPNAWLQISNDNQVIFQLDKTEMGQGIMTGLATVVGEALDIPPARLKVEFAGVHPTFQNPEYMSQLTGGSSSLRTSWDRLHLAGATARDMLVRAAAQQWGISADEVSTQNGELINGKTNERMKYGDVADAAKALEPSETPYIKKPSEYRWIGRMNGRLDAKAKSTGTAEYGVDVQLPGMKTAMVKRCPHFGGSLKSFDASAALKMDGVREAFAIHSGVAVVADSYWQAKKAVDAVSVEWDKGPLAGLNNAKIREQQLEALNNDEGREAYAHGDVAMAMADAPNMISAEYSAPWLHHSPMEPQNTTALVKGNTCELWTPSQGPDYAEALAHQFTGIPKSNITVHMKLMGGGFGRRGYLDYVGEAAAIAQKVEGTPIKLMWSREDDMRHDFYRPGSLHKIQASLDSEGGIYAWEHRFVMASIFKGMAVDMMSNMLPSWVPISMARSIGKFAGNMAAGADPTSAEGTVLPYASENFAVRQIFFDPGIPTGFWRSVGHSSNAFVVESFVDELAHAADKDPLEFRLSKMADYPRHKAVLELAARKAGWGGDNAHLQGLAVHESFHSYCAMVAEVEVNGKAFQLKKVTVAVDCGRVVNPDIVVAQMEGGVIYGLTGALKPPVEFEDGAVVQSNFHDLPVIRMSEAPDIEVHIVESEEAPSGVGEIAVPPLAPALANALFRATGQRLRSMPLQLS
jgi:CO/xanthine dehydrogenase Mo-binding subunit